MPTIAVHIEHIGKRYQIGLSSNLLLQHRSLHAALLWRLRYLRQRLTAVVRRQSRPEFPVGANIIWALNDVSLDIHAGDVVALIGKNGSGKSTLLKILSRITEPTTGHAELYGRVGSMLEVGTGFHPELTGRENIYMNGAILGMTRAEIQQKFDAIVEFSEIERFLDTPVKRFSSGMYVRLAFAVAAHLEPDLLLVDEVLAVGDGAFQTKCLNKMRDVARQGCTVVFVSHDMAAVRALCTRGIVFSSGTVTYDGPIDQAIAQYLPADDVGDQHGVIPAEHVRLTGTHEASLHRLQMHDAHGHARHFLYTGERLRLSAAFAVQAPIRDAVVELGISTLDGLRLGTTTSAECQRLLTMAPGIWELHLDMAMPLSPGRYAVDIGVCHHGGALIERIDQALCFDLLPAPGDAPEAPLWCLSLPARGYLHLTTEWVPPVDTQPPAR